METTTSTGVRGTALSGGPPTKATDDGSLPLTGKAPAEALSVGGEKPTTPHACSARFFNLWASTTHVPH